MGLLSGIKGVFSLSSTSGYDAAKTTSRNRAPSTMLMSEEDTLPKNARRTVVASTRDVRRNFAAARWAINKHLDFVVSHNFKSRSGDRDFDRELEKFVERISRKEHFDVTGRHPRRRFFRLMEAGRLIDGDILLVRQFLDGGGFTQAIEGDRVRDPDDIRKGERWEQGVRVDQRGTAIEYGVHRRMRNSFIFERRVRAESSRLFGYFDRFDQYRGISPLASSITTYTGLYEGLDYALAKAKTAQLFALAIFRDAQDDWNGDDADDDTVAAGSRGTYEVDFTKGPQFLDLDPGDRAEFLESETPGANTQEFWNTMIAIALKAIDIPYSFWDEGHTNFFGSKSALTLYQKSAKEKQYDVREELSSWLVWRLGIAQATKEFAFPAGYDPTMELWSWVPDGLQWWDIGKEVSANTDAVNATFKTRSEVRKEAYGDDWRDVIDELAEEQKYMAEKGVGVPASPDPSQGAGKPGSKQGRESEEDDDEEKSEESS